MDNITALIRDGSDNEGLECIRIRGQKYLIRVGINDRIVTICTYKGMCFYKTSIYTKETQKKKYKFQCVVERTV